MKCPKCSYIRKPDDQGPDYECPKCGVIYAKYNAAVDAQREALEVRVRERAQQAKAAAERMEVAAQRASEKKASSAHRAATISPKDWICTACGSVGAFRRARAGSGAIELVLWICAFVPGLIYSLWRNAGAKRVCSQCEAQSLVLVGSPIGRDLLARTSPHVCIDESAKPRRAALSAGEKVIDWTGKLIIGLVLLMLLSMLALLMLSR